MELNEFNKVMKTIRASAPSAERDDLVQAMYETLISFYNVPTRHGKGLSI
jgi:hypothetical protein